MIHTEEALQDAMHGKVRLLLDRGSCPVTRPSYPIHAYFAGGIATAVACTRTALGKLPATADGSIFAAETAASEGIPFV